MHHFDYEHVAELRGKLIPYEKVEEFVRPEGNDVILDVGAGDGFYSINFAKKLNGGKVIALEIDERGTILLKKKMGEQGIYNIDILQEDACQNFHFSGYNKVFFSNSFHDIPCSDKLVREFAETGNKGLEIVLIEFRKEVVDLGPPAHIRISENELKQKFTSRGFTFSGRLELTHHYLHKYVKD